jgi:hypothetical protein
MLAEEVDYAIGVDTHKDAHTAALVNAAGGVVAGVEEAASDSGYRRLLRLARSGLRVVEPGRWKAPAATEQGLPLSSNGMENG